MRPAALATYQALFAAVEKDAVVTSSAEVIDAAGAVTGQLSPDPSLWTPADRVEGLPLPPNVQVYRVAAAELLKRCLLTVKNPFHFLATAYPRALYEQIEGYGASRLINPDKWFHWRLLGVASYAYYVDAPLFAYRWHATNQTAQQKSSGALKYLVDEYVSSFEVPSQLLDRAGLSRGQLEQAFVEHDIAHHGLATLARGDPEKARRILWFGLSTYPQAARRNWKLWALAGLSFLPMGEHLARLAYSRREPAQ
jgi:hypothetical protein